MPSGTQWRRSMPPLRKKPHPKSRRSPSRPPALRRWRRDRNYSQQRPQWRRRQCQRSLRRDPQCRRAHRAAVAAYHQSAPAASAAPRPAAAPSGTSTTRTSGGWWNQHAAAEAGRQAEDWLYERLQAAFPDGQIARYERDGLSRESDFVVRGQNCEMHIEAKRIGALPGLIYSTELEFAKPPNSAIGIASPSLCNRTTGMKFRGAGSLSPTFKTRSVMSNGSGTQIGRTAATWQLEDSGSEAPLAAANPHISDHSRPCPAWGPAEGRL